MASNLNLAVFVPVATLCIGALVGFLDANSRHVDGWTTFTGLWLGGALVTCLVVWIPVLIVGGVWNATATQTPN
jgi:hypothetical protein